MASPQGTQATAAAHIAEAHEVAKSSRTERVMRSLTHTNGNGIAWHPISGYMNNSSFQVIRRQKRDKHENW